MRNHLGKRIVGTILSLFLIACIGGCNESLESAIGSSRLEAAGMAANDKVSSDYSEALQGGMHPFTDLETGVEYSTFLDLGSVEVKATFEAHGKYYLVIDRLYDSETGLFPDGTDGIYTLKCSKEHYDAVSAGDLLSGTKEYIVDTKEGFLTDINWNSKGYFLSSQEP